jgi:cyclopropane fatty-acyl-phospholipid synthase-like methyltransferase
MASVVAPQSGGYLLDAGCGLGGTACWLGASFNCRVLGVSNSPRNIARCRRFAADRGVANVSFQVADLMSDFGEAGAFDAVWSLESLNYLYPKRDFVRRVFGLLKPGGVWLCMDRFFSPEKCSTEVPGRLVAPLVTGFYGARHWLDEEQVREAMRAEGFERVEFTDLTSAVTDLPRRRRGSAARIVRSVAVSLLHPRSYAPLFRGFRIIRCSYQLMERGAMKYGLASGYKPL